MAWSPRNENILASAGSDGTVRVWDVRRSAGCVGMLDLEDSTGITSKGGRTPLHLQNRERSKAHVGACNGVVWTDDGDFLVSTGHDERVRVWDVATGANTLSHFGPVIRNAHLSAHCPLVVPSEIAERPGQKVMFYPNEKEVLMFDLLEGTLLKRLKVPPAGSGARSEVANDGGEVGASQSTPSSTSAEVSAYGGQRNARNRVTSLAWRAGDVQMYSSHSDGRIRAWMPRTPEEVELDAEEERDRAGTVDEDDERTKKRKALDQIYRDLTKQKITFT